MSSSLVPGYITMVMGAIEEETTQRIQNHLDVARALVQTIRECDGPNAEALQEEALEELKEHIYRATTDAHHIKHGVRQTLGNIEAVAKIVEDAPKGLRGRYHWRKHVPKNVEAAANG